MTEGFGPQDTVTESPKRRPRRWRKWALIVATSILVLLVLYAIIAVRYWNDQPKLTRNFAAEYNARIEKIPEQDRAWPKYRAAFLSLGPMPEFDWSLIASRDSDERWEPFVSWIRNRKSELQSVRQASRLPQLGYTWSDASGIEDARVEYAEAQPSQLSMPSKNPLIGNILLVPVPALRKLAQCLYVEMTVAAADGDGQLVSEDALAIIRIAAHLRETETDVGDFVSIAIFEMMGDALALGLANNPDLLTTDQLEDIQHGIKAYCDGDIGIRLAFEEKMFDDAVQRTYGENGTFRIELAREVLDLGESSFVEKLCAPISAFRAISRAEARKRYDRLLEVARSERKLKLWEISNWPVSAELDGLRQDQTNLLIVLNALFSSSHATAEFATQRRDATLVAIALARFHQTTGHWPQMLDELLPQFLEAIPPDRFDGRPIRYLLDGDQPLLYSVGPDKDDDRGRLASYHNRLVEPDMDMIGAPLELIPDGDWRLWPEVIYAEAEPPPNYDYGIEFPDDFNLPPGLDR